DRRAAVVRRPDGPDVAAGRSEVHGLHLGRTRPVRPALSGAADPAARCVAQVVELRADPPPCRAPPDPVHLGIDGLGDPAGGGPPDPVSRKLSEPAVCPGVPSTRSSTPAAATTSPSTRPSSPSRKAGSSDRTVAPTSSPNSRAPSAWSGWPWVSST